MAYEGGYTSAINSSQARELQAIQAAFERERLTQAHTMFQQQQQQQQRQQQARAMLGDMLPYLSGGGAPGAQPPMPGQPSVPMMPPPPGGGGMPPGGGGPPTAGGPPMPSPAMAGQFLTMPPPPAPGPPPPGAPMAQAGGPGAPMPGQPPRPAGPGGAPPGPPGGMAPPPPPDSWKGLPAPPGGGPAPGGIPAPPEDVVMPRQVVSVGDMAKLLKSRGIEGAAAMDMLDQWKPYMDSANKAELDKMKVHVTAQNAAVKAYQNALAAAERERHNRTTEAQGEKRLGQGQQRINVNVNGAGAESDLAKDPETRRFMAEQYWAGDPSVMQNLGRGRQGAANITALRKEIVAVGKEQGKSPKDLAAATAEFQGLKAGERTLGTRTANVEMAVTEAENMAQIVLDASKKFERTNFPGVNKALKAFSDNTGSTESRQLGAAINSFINAYARAISPSGTPTVHDKEHAREMLSAADSDAQVQAVMGTLRQEMAAAKKSPGQVKSAMREGFTGREGAGGPEYVELRKTPDGRTLGKTKDGRVEVVSP